MLPFTTEQFFGVFESYNRSVWPAQFVLFVVALLLVTLAIWNCRYSDKAIGIGLALLWLWMGAVYHLLFFTAINSAAYVFGCVMIVEALLLFYAGAIRPLLSFRAGWSTYGVAGGLVIVYALAIYPALGFLFGHRYPFSPTFGVPCPTTIFTFGMLLGADRPVPKYILLIPLLWALVGSSAAWLLGIWEDLGLLVAGVVALVMLVYRDQGSPPDNVESA